MYITVNQKQVLSYIALLGFESVKEFIDNFDTQIFYTKDKFICI